MLRVVAQGLSNAEIAAEMKDEAEKEAKEHPQQVSQGDQGVGKLLGMDSQEDQTSEQDQNTPPQEDASQPRAD